MARIHYTIRLEGGEVFDSSESIGEPFDIDAYDDREGALPFPSSVMEAMLDLEPGQTASVVVPPDRGYGVPEEQLVFTVLREKLPKDFEPALGAVVSMTIEGDELLVTVIGVTEEALTLDANHPLAGKTITFELKAIDE